ncbi:MAG: tyrosine-protein phosphatase [Acidimicrobiales bacterium]
MSTAVAHLEVETQPNGELLVRWELEGGVAVAVDVATGSTADHLDHHRATTVPSGQTTLKLPNGAGGRLFVSVAPHGGAPAVVATDRRVPFEGVTNFRDLGGYRTRCGARTRWGLVFRADALHDFSPEDLALYDRLGVSAVYDLREEVEREEKPNPVPSRPLAIIGRSRDTDAGPLFAATQVEGEQILHDLYVGLIDHAAVQIGELFTALCDDDGLPAVIHCHAGKDRTGVVVALLLDALGVERDTILDDYELTARYRLPTQQASTYDRLVHYGISPEAAAGVLGTPRWAMQHALEELDCRFGGVATYLQGPAGMHPDHLETLRQRLLDSTF